MIFNKVYRGEFLSMQVDSGNAEDQKLITVNIYDALSGEVDEPTEIIPLEMAERPAVVSVEDNDEDKFTWRRSKRLEINIHSTDSIGMETFVVGGDNRYYVEQFEESKCKFRGWLSVADIQEDFLPNPNVITLIATDGLGFLDSEPLVNEDDENPTNENSILDYIRWCLRKTGIERDIYINMNTREKTASSLNSDTTGEGHFYKFCYLDAKTFEEEIGLSESCGTTLGKILRPGLFCTQSDGDYWIVLEDEIRYGVAQTFARFDSEGNFIEYMSKDFSKNIGVNEPLGIMDEDMLAGAEQPVKSILTTFPYNYPSEIPCNRDFSRGTGADPTGVASETIDYTLECWDFLKRGSTSSSIDVAPSVGATGKLRKLFEFNYEKERYLVIQNLAGFAHYFKSEAIPLRAKDKFNFGINYHYDSDFGAVRTEVAHIRLEGDDGFLYDWDYDTQSGDNGWIQVTPANANVWTGLVNDNITDVDTREWISFSAESKPVPVSGRLFIRLYLGQANPVFKYYAGLTFTHIPFINGSYQKYKSQTHKVTQEGTQKPKKEYDISISDAPNTLIKGALLKKDTGLEIFNGEVNFAPTFKNFQLTGDFRNVFRAGMRIQISGSSLNDGEYKIVSVSYAFLIDNTTVILDGDTVLESGVTVSIHLIIFSLTEGFYDGSAFPDADYPDDTYVKPYGEMQAFWVFNQYNRLMIRFEGKIDGLDMNDESGDMPDLLHKYYFTDPDLKTNNRVFQLLHYEMDYHLCEWEGFWVQVHNSGEPNKVYTGHEFKYITE
jgi:hypothetical protein